MDPLKYGPIKYAKTLVPDWVICAIIDTLPSHMPNHLPLTNDLTYTQMNPTPPLPGKTTALKIVQVNYSYIAMHNAGLPMHSAWNPSGFSNYSKS